MTDVLAPVEKLLGDALWNQYYSCGACDPAEGPRCTCGNEQAREAVRLLLDYARSHSAEYEFRRRPAMSDLHDKSLANLLFDVRECDEPEAREAYLAIVRRFDALTKERDGLQLRLAEVEKDERFWRSECDLYTSRCTAAEAEVARLREAIKRWEQEALNAAREYEAVDERMLSAQWSAIAFHYSRVRALLGVKEGNDE